MPVSFGKKKKSLETGPTASSGCSSCRAPGRPCCGAGLCSRHRAHPGGHPSGCPVPPCLQPSAVCQPEVCPAAAPPKPPQPPPRRWLCPRVATLGLCAAPEGVPVTPKLSPVWWSSVPTLRLLSGRWWDMGHLPAPLPPLPSQAPLTSRKHQSQSGA